MNRGDPIPGCGESIGYPSPVNQLIELHDSRITAIYQDGGDVHLDLEAYVHRSDGRPGIDPGTGWVVPVRMTIRSAAVVRGFEGEALWITEGTIRVGAKVLDNECPVSMDAADAVEVRLAGQEGSLTVVGTGLRVKATGEAKFVEVFTGAG